MTSTPIRGRVRFFDYWNGVRDVNGFQSVWSLPSETGTDCNGKHPHAGVTALVYREHWGPEPLRVPIEGDTWLDLYRAADRAIRNSEDNHHVYIECFEREGDTLVLGTGS